MKQAKNRKNSNTVHFKWNCSWIVLYTSLSTYPAQSLSHTPTHSHTHTHSNTLTHTHSRSHTLAQSHTHSLSHTHIHTHTYTHTHTRSSSFYSLRRRSVTNTVNLTPIFNKREAVLYACIQLGVKSGRKLKKMKVI